MSRQDRLPHAVDRAAHQSPGQEAVRCAGSALTYQDLAERADRLATLLQADGVQRGDRVGIHAGKGLAAATALYGIMKAGAAYVPLDPASPPSRQAFILRDCGIRHLVTEPSRVDPLRALLAEPCPVEAVIGVEEAPTEGVRTFSWADVAHCPAQVRDAGNDDLDLAYVLYTSGSTGTPKGVVHSHRSALAFARIARDAYGLRADDRLSNHAPLHFDLSTLDYFGAALAGATVVVVPEAHTRLPASWAALIASERLTVLYAVPLALTQLLLHGALSRHDLSAVRWVLFGGEPFPVHHLRSLMAALPRARFGNVYGPTEVNGVTHWTVPPLPLKGDRPIPIGRPYPGVHLRVEASDGTEVAQGMTGELLVHSPTMMAGYWGRADLDASVFCTRPAGNGGPATFFHTGDLVQERPDGLLEFHGRSDRQIKARGHRVELDEVEAALAGHPGVESAATYAVATPDGAWRVGAAVTLRPGVQTTPEVLQAHLAMLLPRYALPERVLVLEQMPLTSTGKLDRRALARLEVGSSVTSEAT